MRHENISEKTARRLRALCRMFLAEPRKLGMDHWVVREDQNHFLWLERSKRLLPPCGTIGCIAGWCCQTKEGQRLHQKYINKFPEYFWAASEYLGITEDQSRLLFYRGRWPEEFQYMKGTREGTKAYAQVVVDRIEHFIENGV